MTDHDPLCPHTGPQDCDLIARVRADERESAKARVLADLRAQVEAVPAEHTDIRHPDRCPACVKDDILALLGGESDE